MLVSTLQVCVTEYHFRFLFSLNPATLLLKQMSLQNFFHQIAHCFLSVNSLAVWVSRHGSDINLSSWDYQRKAIETPPPQMQSCKANTTPFQCGLMLLSRNLRQTKALQINWFLGTKYLFLNKMSHRRRHSILISRRVWCITLISKLGQYLCMCRCCLPPELLQEAIEAVMRLGIPGVLMICCFPHLSVHRLIHEIYKKPLKLSTAWVYQACLCVQVPFLKVPFLKVYLHHRLHEFCTRPLKQLLERILFSRSYYVWSERLTIRVVRKSWSQGFWSKVCRLAVIWSGKIRHFCSGCLKEINKCVNFALPNLALTHRRLNVQHNRGGCSISVLGIKCLCGLLLSQSRLVLSTGWKNAIKYPGVFRLKLPCVETTILLDSRKGHQRP